MSNPYETVVYIQHPHFSVPIKKCYLKSHKKDDMKPKPFLDGLINEFNWVISHPLLTKDICKRYKRGYSKKIKHDKKM